MAQFHYLVTVTADAEDEADKVMAERLGSDEPYGFDYIVAYRKTQPTCDYDGYTEDDLGNERYWHCEELAVITVKAVDPLRGEGVYHVCAPHAEQMYETGEYEPAGGNR